MNTHLFFILIRNFYIAPFASPGQNAYMHYFLNPTYSDTYNICNFPVQYYIVCTVVYI